MRDIRAFFFFQAEDGIRDVAVTGVQTCALPISFLCSDLPQLRARPRCAARERRAPRVPQDARSGAQGAATSERSEEHTSELQSRLHLVCRLLLEKKNTSSR